MISFSQQSLTTCPPNTQPHQLSLMFLFFKSFIFHNESSTGPFVIWLARYRPHCGCFSFVQLMRLFLHFFVLGGWRFECVNV